MADDLVTQLLEAIADTERDALIVGGDPLGSLTAWIEVASPETDAAITHFKRHQPGAVLLRCAADRKTVQDYQEATRKVERAATRVQIMRGHGAADETEAARRLLIAQVNQTTLYEVIERLARTYGITTEETTP